MFLLIAFLGALTASHLCFLGERIALHQSVKGNSHCNVCSRELTLWEVIPVMPWLFARGRARCCRGVIPGRYPLMEAFSALWAGFIFTFFGGAPLLALVLALAGITLVFTRSYKMMIMRQTGVTPCKAHRRKVAINAPGVHKLLGSLRCGWCAKKVAVAGA